MSDKNIETKMFQHVTEGRLLQDHAFGLGHPVGFDRYLEAGGHESLDYRLISRESETTLAVLEAAGLRGRAGAGFPTAVKWRQVANAASTEKYFVCNAHSGRPGGFKESFLIEKNPHRVLEAVAFGAAVVGAKTAIIYLGRLLEQEQAALEKALNEAKSQNLLGPGTTAPDILLYRSPGGYVTGEETALLELLEGRPGRPRGKPPMPTRSGLLGAPTVIDNLETVLQAFFIFKHGAERFREAGTKRCSGTLIFCLSGEVERPGIYELPLGTPLRSLIFDYGGGMKDGRGIKAVLVGGVSGTLLKPDALDTKLDYDDFNEIGGSLGGGVVIVVSDDSSIVDLAIELAGFYYQNSCGKCQPCKDGTGRTLHMLNHLDELDQKATDWVEKSRPVSQREIPLALLNEQAQERASISYTDTATGLDKIRILCKWYEHRGDCQHSAEAARAILSLLDNFESEFEFEYLKAGART
jgi:NADH-quinone oxidoreductase subunit F